MFEELDENKEPQKIEEINLGDTNNQVTLFDDENPIFLRGVPGHFDLTVFNISRKHFCNF